MLLTCRKISDLGDLASLCNRRLPNIEGDRVAQQVSSLQTASQWEYCIHTIALTVYKEVFTVPHLFRTSLHGIHGLRTDSAWTPRGLAGCQHGPDPHTMGAQSPCGVRAESELNARTPRTVPSRNPFARTGFQSARTPLIRIRLQKKVDTTGS